MSARPITDTIVAPLSRPISTLIADGSTTRAACGAITDRNVVAPSRPTAIAASCWPLSTDCSAPR